MGHESIRPRLKPSAAQTSSLSVQWWCMPCPRKCSRHRACHLAGLCSEYCWASPARRGRPRDAGPGILPAPRFLRRRREALAARALPGPERFHWQKWFAPFSGVAWSRSSPGAVRFRRDIRSFQRPDQIQATGCWHLKLPGQFRKRQRSFFFGKEFKEPRRLQCIFHTYELIFICVKNSLEHFFV